jgi:hypothetical protein
LFASGVFREGIPGEARGPVVEGRSVTLILTTGLAAVYLWYLIARAEITAPVFGWARENARLNSLIGCPWCLGFWLTGTITLYNGYNLFHHLAAATIVGIIGAFSE